MKDITDNRRLLVQTTFTTHTFLRNLMTDSITIYNIVTEIFFFLFTPILMIVHLF